MDRDLESYYSQRAREYEKVYNKPERQEDLRRITEILQETFKDRELLEIACGTGYWTEKIAESAREILATDINNTVLKIARTKTYRKAKVTFREADFNRIKAPGNHESLFGGFIWSHIKLKDLHEFIDLLKEQVVPGGLIVLVDNNFVKGSSTPLSGKDKEGNTYQNRSLEGGSEFQVLKNFPTEKSIRRLLKNKATELRFINLKYYWILVFRNG